MHLKQGNLENMILNALWKLEESGIEKINVSEIQNLINTGANSWAYTTVKTVLDRLVEKSFVERIKLGKKYCYKSTISRLAAGDIAIKKLAKQYFNNNIEDLLKSVERLHSEMLVLVR